MLIIKKMQFKATSIEQLLNRVSVATSLTILLPYIKLDIVAYKNSCSSLLLALRFCMVIFILISIYRKVFWAKPYYLMIA